MARTVFSVLFWIWGGLGFLVCTGNYLSLSGSVGVGTSTYMTLGFLYWLGGMVLFGLGAIVVGNDPGVPALFTNPSFQPAERSADETPIQVPPPVPIEREIELAAEEPRSLEPPENEDDPLETNTQIAAPTHNLGRAVFFVVIFLLTMLVVYALLIRK
jgi:hypothetical protein